MRAQSADRTNDLLAVALERIVAANRATLYEERGDVKYFILRFKEVVEANDWGSMAAVLHLRESLNDKTLDEPLLPEIFSKHSELGLILNREKPG